jgi:hypothetical protein
MAHWQRYLETALRITLGLLFLTAGVEWLASQYGLPHVPAILAGVKELWRDGTPGSCSWAADGSREGSERCL